MANEPKSPNSVDEALDAFWLDRASKGHHVPNYMGFRIWISERFVDARSMQALPLHAGTQNSLVQFTWQLLRAAEKAGIIFHDNGVAPDCERFGQPQPGQTRLKALNRAKLLLSYFTDLPFRTRQMYQLMAQRGEQTSSVAPRSSQFEHRAAFFRAIAVGDQHLAFKMVGRLREEEHDVGELAFLEATASFAANRFDEAVQHARLVPSDAIDGPRAIMLILESRAYQGDISAIAVEIAAVPDFKLPQHFVKYLCQIAIENSLSPGAVFKASEELIENAAGREEPGPGTYVMWNRHSCQLAVRVIECLQGLEVAQNVDSAHGSIEDEWENYPLRVGQMVCALAADTDLASRILQSPLDDAYQEVVKRLVNHSEVGPEDYLLALTAQWRIGDHAVFLNNILANLEVLTMCDTPEQRQLLVWGYQEAITLKRTSDAQALKKQLLASPGLAEKLRDIEADAGASALERSLSPMGRLALRSANFDLQQAEKDDHPWRDAGMISLGYFRILELELNERLILPMVNTVDLDDLNEQLTALKANASTKKQIDFWERVLPLLRRAMSDHKGLELGILQVLLKKLAGVSGADAPLKALLHTALVTKLSPRGIAALASGDLANVIAESPRERFRNPPAHSRYLSLTTAKECKVYVERELNQLAQWTRDGVDGDLTIH